MRVCDSFDLPISGAAPAAAAGYDAYVREFLSYGSGLRNFFAIADAAPASAFLNAHAAALHLAFEGKEGWAHAAPYLERMRLAPAPRQREALFCEAVSLWASRDFRGALNALDALTVRWPADLCAVKWGQYHAFNLGDADAMLRLGERARIVHRDRPYAHGLIAFALEQSHRLDEAEDEGLHAVECALDDAWAHHAIAHVMDAQGRAKDGARWLERCAHTWNAKGVFIRDHNWWHAALFRLALGDEAGALAIYDERLWGLWPEFPQEQIGAASMLWRLELRGVAVGARWEKVAQEARRRAGEHFFPFHDLHYLMALARAGAPGEAGAFLVSLEKRADTGAGEPVWREAALPLARGLLAFAEGRFEDAESALSDGLPHAQRIGGSHAQRHVFVECREAAIAALSAGAALRRGETGR